MSFDNNPEHLEYNDGVGDMLREKPPVTFNWSKILFVLSGVIIAIVLGLIFAFYLGKKIVTTGVKATPKELQVQESKPTPTRPQTATPPPTTVIPTKNKTIAETKKPKTTPKKATPLAPKLPVKVAPTIISYRVIYGNYPTEASALEAKLELQKMGISSYSRKTTTVEGNLQTSLQIGAFHQEQKAKELVDQLQKKGISTQIITQ